MRTRLALTAILSLLVPTLARAQADGTSAITVSGGWAAFADEGRIDHGAVGVGVEWRALPHLAVGPELLYMVGPGDDRDLFVVGVVRVGILDLRSRVAPFVTLGGGLMTHSSTYGASSYSSTEGAFIVGGGARLNVSRRVFVAPEFTMGWEPHIRASVAVGIRMP